MRRKAFELHQTFRASKVPVAKAPAIQGLLEKGHRYRVWLESDPGFTRSQLATEREIDPSHLTRLLNLTRLAPEIQSYIRGLPATTHHPVISDRDWHRLARIRDPNFQLQEFKRLKGAPESDVTPMVSSCASGP